MSRLGTPGVIVTAGEFGERLLDHADRLGLEYVPVRHRWGERVDYNCIRRVLAANPGGWLWTVHCETSTGALGGSARSQGPVPEIRHPASPCTASAASLQRPLTCVASGWPAAPAARGWPHIPGWGWCSARSGRPPIPTLPRYLDLALHCGADDGAPPFTLSSSLLAALAAGLARQTPELLAGIEEDGRWLRKRLRDIGLTLVASEAESIGAVTTIALPNGPRTQQAVDSERLGNALDAQGFYTSYASGYLRDRNWLQVCLMGEVNRDQLERFIPVLTAQMDTLTRETAAGVK